MCTSVSQYNTSRLAAVRDVEARQAAFRRSVKQSRPDVKRAIAAARAGDLPLLKSLRSRWCGGCRLNYAVVKAAAGAGHLSVVRYLCEEAGKLDPDFEPTDEGEFSRADIAGDYADMGYGEVADAIEDEAPQYLTPMQTVLRAALEGSHFAVADYLLAHGAELDKALVLLVVENVAALRYLREKQCPRGWGAVLAAASLGLPESLRVLCGEGACVPELSPSQASVPGWGKLGPAVEARVKWGQWRKLDHWGYADARHLDGAAAQQCLDYLFAAGFTPKTLLAEFEAKQAKAGHWRGSTVYELDQAKAHYREKYLKFYEEMNEARYNLLMDAGLAPAKS